MTIHDRWSNNEQNDWINWSNKCSTKCSTNSRSAKYKTKIKQNWKSGESNTAFLTVIHKFPRSKIDRDLAKCEKLTKTTREFFFTFFVGSFFLYRFFFLRNQKEIFFDEFYTSIFLKINLSERCSNLKKHFKMSRCHLSKRINF